MEPSADAPPWCILLSANLPLAHGWLPDHMLRLRCTCKGLRGEVSTGQFFAQLLRSLGVRRMDNIEEHAAARRAS